MAVGLEPTREVLSSPTDTIAVSISSHHVSYIKTVADNMPSTKSLTKATILPYQLDELENEHARKSIHQRYCICRLGLVMHTTSVRFPLRGILTNMTSLEATVSWPSYFSRLKTFRKDVEDGSVWRTLRTSTSTWGLRWIGDTGVVSVFPHTSCAPPVVLPDAYGLPISWFSLPGVWEVPVGARSLRAGAIRILPSPTCSYCAT